MKLYFVRHCRSNYNEKGIFNDDPKHRSFLTEEGIEQANILAELLKKKKIDLIFVSEFGRTKETAIIINKYHKVKLIADPLLNELRLGMNNMPYHMVDKILKKDPYHRVKNGESYFDFRKRVRLFLKKIKAKEYKNVLVVTHAAVLIIIKGISQNIPRKILRKQRLKPYEVIELSI